MLHLYFLWFVVYSFLGWLYETILCSIEEKMFVKRGFLYGPYCPVYGFGAIINVLTISSINNPILLFFMGMLLTCALEYFTSWLLEFIFHARWWDYHYMRFNINGRICLLGAIVFGFFSVIVIKVIQPFLVNIFLKISDLYLVYLSYLLLVILGVDLVFTVVKLLQFNEKLHNFLISSKISETNKNIQLHIDEIQHNNIFKDKIKIFVNKLSKYDIRLLKSFPRFYSTIYSDAIKKIREYLKK